MPYDLAVIRQMLQCAFEESALSAFLRALFPALWSRLADAGAADLVRRFVDEVAAQGAVPALLVAVRAARPDVFAAFEPYLGAPPPEAPPPPADEEMEEAMPGDEEMEEAMWEDEEMEEAMGDEEMAGDYGEIGEGLRGLDETPPQAVHPAPARPNATVYPLWFGTNRAPVDPADPAKGFSGERGSALHYGTCRVVVPRSHQIGSLGSSWWKRLLKRTDDRLRLEEGSLRTWAADAFWADVRQALAAHDPGERAALVFIHGYNVDFEEAALRAAQIGYDLQVPGLTAFFSWPSKGDLKGYPADEAAIEASEPYLTEFLLRFTRESGAEAVHVIAHSMGNRGLLRAMQRILAQVAGAVPFGQIFLAAPDVDPDVFRNLADAYRRLARRTTLYVSSKDKALATSGLVHDAPRLGFCPPVTVVPGLDTVEVSNIDLSFLGHGFYATARDVLQDMHRLLRADAPPDRRFGLRPARAPDGNAYWVIGA